MIVDVIRPTASRFDVFKESTESFLENVIFKGDFRFIVHEDSFDMDESADIVDYCKNDLGIETVKVDYPNIGQGPSLTWLMSQVKADFVFQLEDDWIFLREIDLNCVVDMMRRNKWISEIVFNKRPTMKQKYTWIKKQVMADETSLITCPHWTFIPSLWRSKTIKRRWVEAPKQCIFTWHFNAELKHMTDILVDEERYAMTRDADWVIQNLGTYYLGEFGEPAFVRHLGHESRRLEVER